MAATVVSTKDRIREELLQLERDDRILVGDVIKFAKSHKDSALHAQFPWDLKTAAYKHWQEIARRLIRVHVEIVPRTERIDRVYVSLMNDRKVKGGGYRRLASVLSDDEMRAALLEEALQDLARWRVRYAGFQELALVYEALDKVLEPA